MNNNIGYLIIGKYGSIAIIERFYKSLKYEYTNKISIPVKKSRALSIIGDFIFYYNAYRVHKGINGLYPNNVYCNNLDFKEHNFYLVNTCKKNNSPPNLMNEIRKNPDAFKLDISYYNNNKH